MKIYLLAFVCLFPMLVYSQSVKEFPDVSVENMNGENISVKSILNENGPTIISFWATWCKPCLLELSEMHDVYEEWQEETNVQIIAVSIDDSRSSNKVKTFVNGKSWDFEVVLDKNSDLKRALNINNVPYLIIVNSNGEIVYERNGYVPGDEELVYENLLKL